MIKPVSALLWVLLVWSLPLFAIDDPYIGHFGGELNGQQYRVDIDKVSATSYDGLLQIDDEKMQLDARRYGEFLIGRLASETAQFGFRARVQGGALIMEIDDARRIVFWRTPLDQQSGS